MSLRVDVVESIEAFDGMRAEWDRAVTASPDGTVFLTSGWLQSCWRRFGRRCDGAALHVVVVRDGEGLVAALPLSRARVGAGPARLRTTVLQPLTQHSYDYGGVVLVRRHEEAVEALLGHLAAQLRRDVDGVWLSRMATDSLFVRLLRKHLEPGDTPLAATEIVLPGTWRYADITRGYDLRTHLKRHKVRQRLRRLRERHDDLVFRYHTGDDLDDGVERLLHVFRRRFLDDGDRGWRPSFLVDPVQQVHLRETIRVADAGGWLRLLSLTADGRTVAVELGLELRRTHHLFRGSFDPDFAEFSPGQLMHYQVFEDGIGRGVQEFDFMRGGQDYKSRWTTDERTVVSLVLMRAGALQQFAELRLRAARSLETRFPQAALAADPG